MEKLTYLNRTTTDKMGEPLRTKQGKPYTRLSIKVESKGDRFISGFGNQTNSEWQVGDEVDIVITEAEAKDKEGRPYLNFSMPKPGSIDSEKLQEIYEGVERLQNYHVGDHIILQQILDAVKQKPKGYPTESNETAFDDEIPEDEPPY